MGAASLMMVSKSCLQSSFNARLVLPYTTEAQVIAPFLCDQLADSFPGLGLHICRRLAILMGGEITCQSQEGSGTTFQFQIAYKPVNPGTLDSKATNKDPVLGIEDDPVNADHSVISPNGNILVDQNHYKSRDNFVPIIVLIVEDNIVNQQILAKKLRNTGRYSVLIANHGLEAIEQVCDAQTNGTRIDICLCDIEMPVCNGLDCVRKVRQLESDGTLRERLPFIACSANARQAQLDNMLAAGMDAALSNPFRLAQVEAKIRERLNLD